MMSTNKGIVFKKKTAYSIFLTSDGLFQRGIPLSTTIEVGEEAFFRPFSDVKKRQRPYKLALSAPIIAISAIIMLFFSVLIPSQTTVSAFVQIDINPSIELGIDNDGEVQLFRGINEDGKALKHDISFWKGKSLSWVLQQIVNRTETIHTKTESIEIVTIYQKEVNQVALEKVITTAITTATPKIAAKTQAVHVIEATIKDREAANTEGVSVQKYHAEIEMKKEEKKLKKEQKQNKRNQQDAKIEKSKPSVKSKDLKEDANQKNSKQPENKEIKEQKNPGNYQKDKKTKGNNGQEQVKDKKQQPKEKENSSGHNNKSNKNKDNDKSKDKDHHNNKNKDIDKGSAKDQNNNKNKVDNNGNNKDQKNKGA